VASSANATEPLQPGKRYPYLWKSECKKTIAPVKRIEKALAPQPLKTVTKPAEAPKPVLKPKPAPKLKPKLQVKSKPKKTDKKVEPKKTILDLAFKKYTQPSKGEQPNMSPAIPSANSNAGVPLPLPPTNGLGIAGNFYHRAKLTGALSIGANLGWRPISNFFIRSGVNYNYYYPIPITGN
jgi:outer membrane biosynthesis protein TonB